MKKLLFSLACISAFTFSSCEKDSDDAKTNIEILTSHSWKISGANADPALNLLVDGEILTVTDVFLYYDDCNKDNLYTYYTDGNRVMENSIKCDPSESSSTSTTWNFDSTETRLIIISSNKERDYEIELLDDDNLILNYMDNIGGKDYKMTLKYSK